MLDFQINVCALRKTRNNKNHQKPNYQKAIPNSTIQTNLPTWSLRAAKYIALTGQKQYLASV